MHSHTTTYIPSNRGWLTVQYAATKLLLRDLWQQHTIIPAILVCLLWGRLLWMQVRNSVSEKMRVGRWGLPLPQMGLRCSEKIHKNIRFHYLTKSQRHLLLGMWVKTKSMGVSKRKLSLMDISHFIYCIIKMFPWYKLKESSKVKTVQWYNSWIIPTVQYIFISLSYTQHLILINWIKQ